MPLIVHITGSDYTFLEGESFVTDFYITSTPNDLNTTNNFTQFIGKAVYDKESLLVLKAG